jgi:hypothetical protein
MFSWKTKTYEERWNGCHLVFRVNILKKSKHFAPSDVGSKIVCQYSINLRTMVTPLYVLAHGVLHDLDTYVVCLRVTSGLFEGHSQTLYEVWVKTGLRETPSIQDLSATPKKMLRYCAVLEYWYLCWGQSTSVVWAHLHMFRHSIEVFASGWRKRLHATHLESLTLHVKNDHRI